MSNARIFSFSDKKRSTYVKWSGYNVLSNDWPGYDTMALREKTFLVKKSIFVRNWSRSMINSNELLNHLSLSKNFSIFQSEFDESLKNSEECPLMIPKYFANVQPKAGFDKKQISYHKKPVQTKEQCVQLCCNLKDCNIVFMYKENSQLTCFHVSYYNINTLSYPILILYGLY